MKLKTAIAAGSQWMAHTCYDVWRETSTWKSQWRAPLNVINNQKFVTVWTSLVCLKKVSWNTSC